MNKKKEIRILERMLKFLKCIEAAILIVPGLITLIINYFSSVIKSSKHFNKFKFITIVALVLDKIIILISSILRPIVLFFKFIEKNVGRKIYKEDIENLKNELRTMDKRFYDSEFKRLKEIRRDADFYSFAMSDFYQEWIIDDVLVTLKINPKDYNCDIWSILHNYKESLEIVNEFEKSTSSTVRRGMKLFNLQIHMCSPWEYNLHNSNEDSLGCYHWKKKEIYIKIEDNESNLGCFQYIEPLHHEIGHFIDNVAGISKSKRKSTCYSEKSSKVRFAFKNEIHTLFSEYAKTNYREFFAVAYERIMNGRISENTDEINTAINEVVCKFEEVVKQVELSS